jgi:hypothetical protein
MQAARMQFTNVEFMEQSACRGCGNSRQQPMGWQATGGRRSLDDDVSRDGEQSGGDRYIRQSGDESLIGSDNVHGGSKLSEAGSVDRACAVREYFEKTNVCLYTRRRSYL